METVADVFSQDARIDELVEQVSDTAVKVLLRVRSEDGAELRRALRTGIVEALPASLALRTESIARCAIYLQSVVIESHELALELQRAPGIPSKPLDGLHSRIVLRCEGCLRCYDGALVPHDGGDRGRVYAQVATVQAAMLDSWTVEGGVPDPDHAVVSKSRCPRCSGRRQGLPGLS